MGSAGVVRNFSYLVEDAVRKHHLSYTAFNPVRTIIVVRLLDFVFLRNVFQV